MKPEAALVDKCKTLVKNLRKGGLPIKLIKLHGSQFSERGTPDLHVTVLGRSLWVECKAGTKVTAIQEQRLREWEAAGAVVGVISSVEEFRKLIERTASLAGASWSAP